MEAKVPARRAIKDVLGMPASWKSPELASNLSFLQNNNLENVNQRLALQQTDNNGEEELGR